MTDSCVYFELPAHAVLLNPLKRDILSSMKSDPQKLVAKNPNLTHSDSMKVVSHVQREQGDWILHSVMVEDCDVPFKFKRKGKYQSLKGAKVNMTYYPEQEMVAGLSFEVMRVVRIKRR